MPHYHPTLAEIWTYPAGELAEQMAGSEASVWALPGSIDWAENNL
jgi:hypothetical protein